AAAILAISVIVIVDEELRGQIIQFASADIAAVQAGYAGDGEREAREVIQQRMSAPGASDFFLLERNGERLAGNLAPMAPRTGTLTLRGAGRGHSILGVGRLLAPGIYVFSGSDINHIVLARRQILRIMTWIFAGALVLGIAGGVLVSRSFLS